MDALLRQLGTAPSGLSDEEARRRLGRAGPNALPEPRGRPAALLLLDQVTHFMALLLWVAGGLAFAARTPDLGWAIWAVVCVNGAFSYWQERRAERALQALQERLPLDARAWRSGRLLVVPSRELVPGDVVELAEGDRVCADARLLSAESLRLDLSLLTGESEPVERRPSPGEPGERASDAAGVAFAGSSVVSGRARGVVYATGAATELGQVARLTARVKPAPSTLAAQVAAVVRMITALAVAMGLAVFLLSRTLLDVPAQEGLLFAIGIVVANVPEGLLPTITLALALAVQRMARRRVLVRRLPAIETLSAVSVICTDKTGTLTLNRMAVREAFLPGAGWRRVTPGEDPGPALRFLLTAAALCTEAGALPGAGLDGGVRDAMDAALLAAWREAAGPGAAPLDAVATRLRELPFDPARRRMTVLARWAGAAPFAPGAGVVLTKGAPLELLDRCGRLLEGGRAAPLDAAARAALRAENDRLAARGYRMLGVAFREGPASLAETAPEEVERELTFAGLLAIADPPRPGVSRAVETCRRAGIAVTMVTGDYGVTAAAVAREVGMVGERARVVSGAELAALDEAGLRALLGGGGELVFARVLPDQKLRLVRAYQALGHVVAVTGDGVNDAPALKAAHVGIAMGASGTDVARAAADLVLLDDDFASIVTAVEEGRAIFQNLRKFLAYILASNVPEIVPYLAMVALRIPPALTILQILGIDLGTDMVPALALGGEPPEPGLMDRPPRPAGARLLDRELLARAYLRLGLVQAAASMAVFLGMLTLAGLTLAELQRLAPALLARAADPGATRAYQAATTGALAAIVLCQAGNLFACRSERLSAFAPHARNRLRWLGLASEAALLLAIVYAPSFQHVFGTAPLPAGVWAATLVGPVALLAVDEAWKWMGARRAGQRPRRSPGPRGSPAQPGPAL
ncbi:ATPase [Anaeromyxobacter paludicola]|uniref:ATPase n=1 Tax=Anaeromyxobacter paludicola TaxID=2918171 RepID=A0ABN6N5V7_9BACT|nr:ATPase [Anaeromyxobacter paludicola]